MVVDARAAGSLIDRLLRPANCARVQQEQSFWAGKIGQPAFSKKLAIVDDPLIPRGLGSRPFDGEGIAARDSSRSSKRARSGTSTSTPTTGSKLELKPTTGEPLESAWSTLGKRSR